MRVRKLQITRRSVQLLVVALVLTVPAVARYNNYLAARELDQKLERWQGTLPGASLAGIDRVMRALPDGEMERAGKMQRNRTRVLEYGQEVRGGPWSAEIAGVSLTDPLAVVESVAASRRLPWVLLAGLLVPLIVTALLGRVYCSWICPMGLLLEMTDKLRGLLRFLEIRPFDLRPARSAKYWLLGAGILLAAMLAVPVLGYVYPPALLSRELHDLVFVAFDRAELGKRGLWVGSLSWMSMVLGAIVLIEVSLSRRWWCRYVCPGAAIYALVGWARPLRVNLQTSRCSDCGDCVKACPMALNPMGEELGMECDGCGVCISSCADKALAYGVGRRPSPALDPIATLENVSAAEVGQ